MFSIIMPYYKNAHVVKRGIDSVLSQTNQDFELIIVDDGSEDNIDQIVQEYNNPSIHVIHKKNGGVSDARNCGILHAKGDYVCFLDSDDKWYPTHLSELSKMIERYPSEGFFLTSHIRIGNQEVKSSDILSEFDDIFVEPDLVKLCFNYTGILHTNSVCLNRSFLMDGALFDTTASIGEDTDLWFRLAMRGNVIISKKVTTMYYRDNSFLTKKRKFNYDWPFLKQYQNAKENNLYFVKLMCDRHLIAGCKHMLADGDKKGAQGFLKKIEKPLGAELKKAYCIAKVLSQAPLFVSKEICTRVYQKQVNKY